MNKVLWIAGLMFAATAVPAQAAFITFDTQPDQYFVTPIIEGDFVFSSNYDGFGTNNNSLWPSNGTIHLMSWTNSGSLSGFTLSHFLGNEFSVSSFDFAGGYVDGRGAVSSLTVTGLLGASVVQSTSFIGGIDFTASGPSSLTTLNLAGFSGIDSLVVVADGEVNRASYDNFFVVAGAASAVPEPASIAMWGISALGLTFARRKRRQLLMAA